MVPIDSTLYEFDRYQLNIGEGVLLCDGKPVTMQWKAFETLCVLVQAQGRLVSREELIEAIWPDSFVEENNLSQQIRALRKLLGNGDDDAAFIETVPRRGYRFLLPVNVLAVPHAVINGSGNGSHLPDFTPSPNSTPEPTVKAETGSAQASPVLRRSFSRKAIVITVICVSIVSVLGFISWRNRPRVGSAKIWNSPSGTTQSLFAAATVKRIGGANDGVISSDGKRIAYTIEVAGKQTLWLQQVASGISVQIAGPLERGYGKLLFSGDGEFVYYSTGTSTGFDIYRVSIFGGEPEKLADGTGAQFAVSPGETHIAAVRRDTERKLCSLVTVNLADGTVNPISVTLFSRCFGALAWAPNGRFIAASLGDAESGASNNELIEISADGQEKRSLTNEKWVIIRDILWLPDRRSLLLTGRRKQSDYTQLWLVRRSTGETKQVSKDTSNYSTISLANEGYTLVAKKTDLKSQLFVAPVEMPDRGTAIVNAFGRIAWLPRDRIVYGSYKQDSLWAINADGSGNKQIGANNDGSIARSPDGRHIYTVSAETGSFHIWRMNSDGSNRVQFTKTKESEQYPAISPDNRWVYFDSISPEGTSIRRMPVSGGASQTVQPVGASRPSISPDGRMLAFLQENQNGSDQYGIGISRPDGSDTRLMEPAGRITGSRMEWTEDSTAIYYSAKEPDSTVNIWLHPLDGGPPVKITNFSSDRIFDFAFSPDRLRIAYVRGNWTPEIVKMDFMD